MDQEGYLNVALFGLDTRENDVEMGTRSDTIMVAEFGSEDKGDQVGFCFPRHLAAAF